MDFLLIIIAIAVSIIAVEPGTKLYNRWNNWIERKRIHENWLRESVGLKVLEDKDK